MKSPRISRRWETAFVATESTLESAMAIKVPGNHDVAEDLKALGDCIRGH